MSLTNTQVAETYLQALESKDPSRARLAPDVTLQYPLSPRMISGDASVIEYLSAMMTAIDAVEIERHISEGDYVVTLWQAHTVWGVIPVCHVFQIAEETIREIRSFFDPRQIGPLR
jgi:limonene-1,2-epoxide hydrolase